MNNHMLITRLRFKAVLSMFMLATLITAAWASTPTVTISVHDVTVKQLLEQLEQKSNYSFAYSDTDLPINKKVTVNASNKSIEDIISEVLPDVSMTVKNKQIVLTKAPAGKKKTGTVTTAASATGVVTDETGEPLPGAPITVAGTTKGVTTDVDGRFSIADVPIGSELRVSYVGCKPTTVKWQGVPLDIKLLSQGQDLNELVVVGFGTQKKVNLTGAVSTVSADEIQLRPVNTLTDAIQGLVPGLEVGPSSQGGALNASRPINIRGVGTIGQGSSVVPLVLIDGMEGDINSVSIDNVDNISILKDAAASSIYGSRAAGGVILITTKKAKEGKIEVNYNNNFRWARMERAPKMADSWSWAVAYNDAAMNMNGSIEFPQEILDEMLACQKDPSLPTMKPGDDGKWAMWQRQMLSCTGNTDWIDEHFGKTSFSQEHNLSITGGSERLKYYFSGNIISAGGILRYGDDHLQKINVTGKADLKITNWLTLQYATRWNRNNYDAPSALKSTTWDNVMRYWPNIPTHDPNGNPVVESYIECFSKGGRNQTWTDFMDQQFNFTLTPVDGLTVNANFNYRNTAVNNHTSYLQCYGYDVAGNAYACNPNNFGPSGWESSVYSSVYDTSKRVNYFNPNIYGTYNLTVAEKNNFTIMAGYQSEYLRERAFNANRSDPTNNIPYLDLAIGNSWGMGGNTNSWSVAGWFGRFNYDFDGRYLFEANIRYDGTSRFRSGRRWTWSPSFSAAWNIAREKFWESLNPYVNTLKIRASWGKLSNQNTNNWYPTYSQMGFYPNNSNWIVNGVRPTYATPASLISESLTWEKNRTIDVGLDFGLLNNRLTGTFDYYQRKTEDMVGDGKVMPDVLGTSNPPTNNISMTSKGWELSISWRNRINDFYYGITANLYDHKVVIDEFPNENKTLSRYYAGQTLGEIWGYEAEIARSNQQMADHLAALDAAYTEHFGHAPSAPNQGQNQRGNNWLGGDMMYMDIDGDGLITQGENTLENHGDKKIIGNDTPRYNFGITLDAAYKGFDIRLFFQGVGKRDYWPSNGYQNFHGFVDFWNSVVYTEHLDYFRPEDTTSPLGPNVDSYYCRPNFYTTKNTTESTHYLQNAAYLKLKNLTIGYTLPQNLTRKFYVEKFRIYFSGENLFTVTKFTKLGDPELVDTYKSVGFIKTYPQQRVLSCGLNITL